MIDDDRRKKFYQGIIKKSPGSIFNTSGRHKRHHRIKIRVLIVFGFVRRDNEFMLTFALLRLMFLLWPTFGMKGA